MLPELVTLVLSKGWDSLCEGREHDRYEQDILPSYLPNQRWFAAKDKHVETFRSVTSGQLSFENDSWLLTIAEAKLADGERQSAISCRSPLPGSRGKKTIPAACCRFALGRARRGPRTGLIHGRFRRQSVRSGD